jgi:hypothetical protein
MVTAGFEPTIDPMKQSSGLHKFFVVAPLSYHALLNLWVFNLPGKMGYFPNAKALLVVFKRKIIIPVASLIYCSVEN